MKSRFLLESIIGPRTLQTAMQLTASVAIYSKDKDPPAILIDDHLPYPKAILQVFGQIKHRRRRNGRGRLKHPRLKPPADLQVGVVKKIRDNRGNLLKVSTKASFGKKKDIEKAKELTVDLTKEDKQQIEKDVKEIIGDQADDNQPVILELENIRILKPGKYELDLVDLFKGRPLVYKLEDGKYMIDLISGFEEQEED